LKFHAHAGRHFRLYDVFRLGRVELTALNLAQEGRADAHGRGELPERELRVVPKLRLPKIAYLLSK